MTMQRRIDGGRHGERHAIRGEVMREMTGREETRYGFSGLLDSRGVESSASRGSAANKEESDRHNERNQRTDVLP